MGDIMEKGSWLKSMEAITKVISTMAKRMEEES